ncbi:MAG: MFS transporter [Bacteroidota bacterium]
MKRRAQHQDDRHVYNEQLSLHFSQTRSVEVNPFHDFKFLYFRNVIRSTLWTRNFVLLTLSHFLMCAAYYSLISTLPLFISNELKTTHGMVGLIMASYAVAAILIRPFTGFGLDFFGRKTIFLSSLLVFALVFNAYLFVTGVFFLIVVRVLHGFTWGVTSTANSTIAGDLIPAEKRGEGFGYFGVTATSGMAIGPLIGSMVLERWGYHAMFISGLFMGLISLFLALLIRYPHFVVNPDLRFSWRNLLESRSIIPSINLLITGLSYGGLLSFITLFGKEIGIHNPSGFFLIYACGIISARILSGKRVDRQGPKKILLFCLSLMIIGFPLLALVKNPYGFFGSAIILGFGNGVIWPTFQAMINNIVEPQSRGAANSTAFIAMDLGMGLGMILAGAISEHFSITAAFLFCSVICFAGLMMFLNFTLKHYLNHRVS